MGKQPTAAIALFGILCTTASALAHHSFSGEFDSSKLIAVKGVLTRVEWQNPHMWFYVDVKDENGNVANWGFENTSIALIRRQYPDARKDLLANIGKVVRIVACPAWRVPHMAAAEAIKFENGTILRIPGGGGQYKGNDTNQALENVK